MSKSLYIFFFFLLACETSEYPPKAFELEIEAVLEAGKTAKASVKRVFSIGEIIDENQQNISSIELVLYRDGVYFDSLQYQNDGFHESVRTLPIQGQYILKGKSKEGVTFESVIVEIPELTELPILLVKSDTLNYKNPTIRANYVELGFDNRQSGKYVFFDVNFPENIESLHTSRWFASEFVQKEINNCLAPAFSIFSKNGYLYNNSCLGERKVAYLIEKEAYSYSDSSPVLKRFNQMVLKVGFVSPAFFHWSKVKSIQPSGRERFSVDPVMTYSNFQGAYGVIYGINSKTVLFP